MEALQPVSKCQKMSPYTIDDLPDELILLVVSFLNMKEIIKCGQVSKRIRSICSDETIWQKVNLYNKIVPVKFLIHLIDNKCKYLSLLRSKICIFKLYGSPMKLNQYCELKVLDLGYCNADYQVVEELLSSCHSLENLSMKGYTLNSKIIEALSLKNGKTMKVLNLSSCKGLVLESIQLIVRNCLELRELNLEYTNLSNESISLLSNELTTKIEKLSLNWLKIVKDEHIVAIVNRCKNLITLDLAFNSITNLSLNSIVENLRPTLEELDVNYTKVTFEKVLELRSMEKIRILNFWKSNHYPYEAMNLKKLLNLRINHNSSTVQVADSNSSAKPKEMFWKIKAKQLSLFQANPVKK